MSVKMIEKLFGATIKFVPELSNEVNSLYAVTAGANHVFDVVVNNLTHDIKIVFADATECEILDAKVKTKPVVTEDGVSSRPSSDSVKSIIYPRIIWTLSQKLAGGLG